jgi:hypothetical protein
MENFLIQNNRVLANAMNEKVKTQDVALNASNTVEFICNSQRFLHFLAAKKLGFPVTLRKERLDDPDASGQEDGKGSNQSSKNRFLFNNNKTGGQNYGDQIEV